MYLEILDIPDLDMRGGAIAFAWVPWTMQLTKGSTLRERILNAMDAFIEVHGAEPSVRLVIERSDEIDAFPVELYAALASIHGCTAAKTMADYFGIDAVVYARGEELTPLEQKAARAIVSVISEYAATGIRVTNYHVTNAVAKLNLTRAVRAAGLTLTSSDDARSILGDQR